MASSLPMRSWSCLRSAVRGIYQLQGPSRSLSSISLTTKYTPKPEPKELPKNLPPHFYSQLPHRMRPDMGMTVAVSILPLTVKPKMKIKPAPPSTLNACPDPVAAVTEKQLAVLDPTGERRQLFDYRRNPRSAKVGDILRVTFKSGDPFSGVCLNIRQRGIDTAFLLRNELTRVPVEMWIKVFSPNVQSVEIVQRTEKRKRRARIYYMRQPKHDIGSVENIVQNYLKQKSAVSGQS